MKAPKRVASNSKKSVTNIHHKPLIGRSSPGSKENMSVFGNNYVKWLKTSSKASGLKISSPGYENGQIKLLASPGQLIKTGTSGRLSSNKSYGQNIVKEERALTPNAYLKRHNDQKPQTSVKLTFSPGPSLNSPPHHGS